MPQIPAFGRRANKVSRNNSPNIFLAWILEVFQYPFWSVIVACAYSGIGEEIRDLSSSAPLPKRSNCPRFVSEMRMLEGKPSYDRVHAMQFSRLPTVQWLPQRRLELDRARGPLRVTAKVLRFQRAIRRHFLKLWIQPQGKRTAKSGPFSQPLK